MPDSKSFQFRPDRDCDQNGNTNEVRAQRALSAALDYAEAAGIRAQDDDIPEEAIQDLLCDLMHLCDQLRSLDEDYPSFEEMLQDARSSYQEER